MVSKEQEKTRAIELRKQGLSYSEILAQVPVAKSSLALWLQSVNLSKKQHQRITEKKLASALRGALKKKEYRILRSNKIKEESQKEVGQLSKREIWLIGAALYWAEGAKEKEWDIGTQVRFSNSDSGMIRFFLFWLTDICGIDRNAVCPEIYIHESHRDNIKRVIEFWSKETLLPLNKFRHVYFKKNKINTKRKNTGEGYFGLLRLRVNSSSVLNRRISGWVEGMLDCLS